ncbi:hypothetical protein BVRB_4g093900 [Beta vulgaris subsp. vulgaris]|nr:hypothetical protein BVRB_4g093900 [Beta vulgaris subsp. vulgaris]
MFLFDSFSLILFLLSFFLYSLTTSHRGRLSANLPPCRRNLSFFLSPLCRSPEARTAERLTQLHGSSRTLPDPGGQNDSHHSPKEGRSPELRALLATGSDLEDEKQKFRIFLEEKWRKITKVFNFIFSNIKGTFN